MLKTLMHRLIITTMLATGVSGAHAASPDCVAIGGVGAPNFVPQADGTTTIVAPLSGSVVTAAGKITASRETATGLEMDMEHYFMNDTAGFMHTRDIGVLTPVEGKPDRYMIEVTYHVQADTTSGTFAGYSGTFNSYGLVDLENQQGLIRYSGQVCK